MIAPAALSIPAPSGAVLFPANLPLSGQHYFADTKTATFNLHTASANYGIYMARRAANTSAPANAASGPDGGAAVPWLKLDVIDPPEGSLPEDSAAGVREIYRVNTAGGSAPKSCEGRPAAFQVEYSAEYWFYAPRPST